MHIKYLFARLMNEETGGEGSGGGGAVDRGDDYVPPDEAAAKAADEAAAKAVADDAKEAEEAEVVGKASEEEAVEEDDQPRDKDGKFAKKDGVMIPKARFDEVNRKARDQAAAMQARIEQLERQTQAAAAQTNVAELDSKVTELEDEYQKLLDDGKTEKAKEVMRQIRQTERQIIAAQVEHKSEQARQLAVEQFKVDTLIDKIESEFPALNPNSEDYSQEIVDEVMFLRAGFERNGLPSSQAIAKAVKYVLGAAPAPAKEEEKAPKKGLSADTKAAERRQEQLKKNLDAAAKQPPRLDTGVDSNKKGGGVDGKAVTEMSEEEFAALPASTKARLRGDLMDDVAA